MSSPSAYPTISSFNQDLNKLNNDAVQGNVNFPPNSTLQKLSGGASKRRPSSAKKSPKPVKVKLCGRERTVKKDGDRTVVVINKRKVELSRAKEMDKKYKEKKAAKEASAKKAKSKSKRASR